MSLIKLLSTGIDLYKNLKGEDDGLDRETRRQIAEVREHYKAKNGIFSNWLQTIRNKHATANLKALTEHERAIIEHGAVLENAARDKKSERVRYNRWLQEERHFLIQLAAKEHLLKAATNAGMFVEDYSDVNKQIALGNHETKKVNKIADKEAKRAAKKAKQETELRLKEYKEKAELDFDIELREAQERLRLEIIANYLSQHQQVSLIQDLIDAEHIKIADIQQSSVIPASAKPQMILHRERIIDMFMKEQDERLKKALHP